MDDRKRLLCLFALAAVLVLVNAVVCGALSAPVPRYQARLIWLIPAIAMLGGLTLAPQVARKLNARATSSMDS